ncbi:periplasmic protein [mine drainage metagenome]|uniref:Periplasmic protein n=1 Tax=mine drainage metagenome TaxID=410659 RepID=A0A1J5RE33_9ZZZZ
MKSDAKIKKDVSHELEWDPSIDAAAIGVEVQEGIVTLAGHVSRYSEKIAAEKATQRVAGIRGITIELDVVLPVGRERSDADIVNAVEHVLAWNNAFSPSSIQVMVENGFVTLSGSTDWEYQRQAAEQAIRHLHGVKGVRNEIQLSLKIVPSDIKVKIEAALQRRAHKEAAEITVRVEAGKITLGGKVHTFAECQAAIDAAWSAEGVTDVVNQMIYA